MDQLLNDDPTIEATALVSMLVEESRHLAEPFVQAWLAKRDQASAKDKAQQPVPCIREWLWFPMIYTREKRGDIVDWAPRYGITGFLFAGKPGCLCLEGTEKNVASFINDIKTISWANIPAGHKKISTKWQQRFTCESLAELDSHRLFSNMQELIFEASGKFKNHNDLAMLKKWMIERHVGDAFTYLFDY
ncbi:hypothetical protein DM01DRAFT_1334366 [Hesseltinella vesiculosa]|uniref:Small nuclear ribonucleoprotein Prp3 C-terminal domain-containing protein n=1 Tax=Hesseltinella vesiculosa TaxID=101127 RepID=A0A1X2GLY2_9FUNG|nr:hypothetical protein DM01DRAFT_1334366 [Hesseltinella vesiculosa]